MHGCRPVQQRVSAACTACRHKRVLRLAQRVAAARLPARPPACPPARLPTSAPLPAPSRRLGLDSEPLRRHYIRARLALCRFACQHQQTLVLLLAGELALCLVWLAIYLVRSRREGEGAQDQEPGDDCTSPQRQQFVIASAADPQWREDAAQLRQPLLSSSDSC